MFNSLTRQVRKAVQENPTLASGGNILVWALRVVRPYVGETTLNLFKRRLKLGDHRFELRAAASRVDYRTYLEDFELALYVSSSFYELLSETFFGFHDAPNAHCSSNIRPSAYS